MPTNNDMREEMNQVIADLQKQGIDVNAHLDGGNAERIGLGDVVERTLQKFGITEDRFKQWFGLKECGCSKRKKWLNGLFNWTEYNKRENK
jgi:hypothetical protein